ncbi:uncharacterized protein LOC118645671 isoform X2 [Monomorium pharaonis]|uniref:uncharacterized protein LOC118645671 isoform X2 n=1 Tax=Monomorium pharaonis TaxID=307658 RepID=UPI001747A843|nr:uncharacterized protein LOC118645671 isoform X2 [Monomorium pharaonis]
MKEMEKDRVKEESAVERRIEETGRETRVKMPKGLKEVRERFRSLEARLERWQTGEEDLDPDKKEKRGRKVGVKKEVIIRNRNWREERQRVEEEAEDDGARRIGVRERTVRWNERGAERN